MSDIRTPPENEPSPESSSQIPSIRDLYLGLGGDVGLSQRYFPTEAPKAWAAAPAHLRGYYTSQYTDTATSHVPVTVQASVYVAGLASHVDGNELRRACSAFGALSATVRVDPTTGASLCNGFVAFPDLASAQSAVERMHGQYIPAVASVPLTVRLADSTRRSLGLVAPRPSQRAARLPPQRGSWFPPPYTPVSSMRTTSAAHDQVDQARVPLLPPTTTTGTRLYVGGLPFETDHDWLLRAFRPYGRVLHSHLPLGHKGFGFVVMASFREAVNAIKALDGAMTDANVRLEVQFARK
jgi:hypothetical protein